MVIMKGKGKRLLCIGLADEYLKMPKDAWKTPAKKVTIMAKLHTESSRLYIGETSWLRSEEKRSDKRLLCLQQDPLSSPVFHISVEEQSSNLQNINRKVRSKVLSLQNQHILNSNTQEQSTKFMQ